MKAALNLVICGIVRKISEIHLTDNAGVPRRLIAYISSDTLNLPLSTFSRKRGQNYFTSFPIYPCLPNPLHRHQLQTVPPLLKFRNILDTPDIATRMVEYDNL